MIDLDKIPGELTAVRKYVERWDLSFYHYSLMALIIGGSIIMIGGNKNGAED